jgi:hypothetical protein
VAALDVLVVQQIGPQLLELGAHLARVTGVDAIVAVEVVNSVRG